MGGGLLPPILFFFLLFPGRLLRRRCQRLEGRGGFTAPPDCASVRTPEVPAQEGPVECSGGASPHGGAEAVLPRGVSASAAAVLRSSLSASIAGGGEEEALAGRRVPRCVGGVDGGGAAGDADQEREEEGGGQGGRQGVGLHRDGVAGGEDPEKGLGGGLGGFRDAPGAAVLQPKRGHLHEAAGLAGEVGAASSRPEALRHHGGGGLGSHGRALHGAAQRLLPEQPPGRGLLGAHHHEGAAALPARRLHLQQPSQGLCGWRPLRPSRRRCRRDGGAGHHPQHGHTERRAGRVWPRRPLRGHGEGARRDGGELGVPTGRLDDEHHPRPPRQRRPHRADGTLVREVPGDWDRAGDPHLQHPHRRVRAARALRQDDLGAGVHAEGLLRMDDGDVQQCHRGLCRRRRRQAHGVRLRADAGREDEGRHQDLLLPDRRVQQCRPVPQGRGRRAVGGEGRGTHDHRLLQRRAVGLCQGWGPGGDGQGLSTHEGCPAVARRRHLRHHGRGLQRGGDDRPDLRAGAGAPKCGRNGAPRGSVSGAGGPSSYVWREEKGEKALRYSDQADGEGCLPVMT